MSVLIYRVIKYCWQNTLFLTLVAAAAGSWSPCRLRAAQDRRCRLICRSLSASSRGSYLTKTTATLRRRRRSSRYRQDSQEVAGRAATEWRSLNPSIAFSTRPAAIVTELAFSTLPVCFETIPAEEPLTSPIVAVISPRSITTAGRENGERHNDQMRTKRLKAMIERCWTYKKYNFILNGGFLLYPEKM